MMKPAGTGSPIRSSSPRFAPFPPGRGKIPGPEILQVAHLRRFPAVARRFTVSFEHADTLNPFRFPRGPGATGESRTVV